MIYLLLALSVSAGAFDVRRGDFAAAVDDGLRAHVFAFENLDRVSVEDADDVARFRTKHRGVA